MSTSPDLRALVLAALERLEQGQDASAVVEDLCADRPDLAEGLRQRLSALHRFGVLPTGGEATVPERLGDYHLVEALGGGGMGVVYLAEQRSLGRRVALKVVHPAQLLVPGARERFRREVETVAALQHPGIVPIHDVGEQEGVPYFTMPAVRGCTLHQILDDLAGRDAAHLTGADMAAAVARCTPGAAPGDARGYVFAGSWEVACLTIGRQVAEALHHAHEAGVVHRDVKPGNIMVGCDGRAMLLDFGLASTADHAGLTRDGSPLGSLPYMSPELTRGDHDAVDARTDVYGLGITLSELFTLAPVYDRRSGAATVRAIQLGEREPPRRLNSALSWEAETICLTASDPDPERRYASAADLARDLANVLEHRPIGARRAGTWLRTRRWVQRHPVAAVSTVLGLALVVGGPGLYAWQAHQAAARLRVEQDRTDAERRRAEAHLVAAVAAVDTMLVRVADHTLRNVPQLESVRRDLADEAVRLHRGLLAQEGLARDLVLGAARALQLAGEIHNDLGDIERSEALHREAVTRLEVLLENAPDDAEAEHELSVALRKVALSAHRQGEAEAARELTARALEIQDPTSAEPDAEAPAPSPAQIAERVQLGLTLVNSGGSLAYSDPASAVVDLEEAVALFEDLSARDPDEVSHLVNLATARGNLAAALGAMGRIDEASAHNEACLALLGQALARDPDDVRARKQLAMSLGNLGLDVIDDDGERGRTLLERSVDGFRGLTTDFPDTSVHREDLARMLGNLARVHAASGDEPGAVALYHEALSIQEDLLAATPASGPLQRDLAIVANGLSGALRRQGRLEEAKTVAMRAVEVGERLLRQAPADPSRLSTLSYALLNLGLVLRDADEPAMAEGPLEMAIDHMERALDRRPEHPENTRSLEFQRETLDAIRERRAGADGP